MIIGEIKRAIRDNNSIRVSRSLRDIAYRTLKAREELLKNNDREPSIDEISVLLDIPVKDVACAMEAISDPMSLCDPVYSDDDDTIYLMDQVSDDRVNEDSWIENMSLKSAMEELSDREREILTLRYYVGKTQMEVSEDIGISQAQVSRLEKNALASIKKSI